MRPVWKSTLFMDLLTIPAALVKTLRSRNIGLKQLPKGIEVKPNKMVGSFQVSQVCNHSIEQYESY